jgi:hypothetical protein
MEKSLPYIGDFANLSQIADRAETPFDWREMIL